MSRPAKPVHNVDVVVVTGMSGSGKSTAINALEDAGYYCIDNLPTELVPRVVELCAAGTAVETEKVALGLDVRDISYVENWPRVRHEIEHEGHSVMMIFVDADVRGLPGSIEIHVVDPETAARDDADARGQPGASSHHVGGGELVALAAQLTGARPEAVAVGIGVADLELGEGLSPAVEAVVPKVVDLVVNLADRHLAEA